MSYQNSLRIFLALSDELGTRNTRRGRGDGHIGAGACVYLANELVLKLGFLWRILAGN
jgi:hypothetical protein